MQKRVLTFFLHAVSDIFSDVFSNPLLCLLRVEILSDWKSLSAALLDDAAVEARSDASTSNLLLLLKDAAHKAVGGQLVPSRQEAR